MLEHYLQGTSIAVQSFYDGQNPSSQYIFFTSSPRAANRRIHASQVCVHRSVRPIAPMHGILAVLARSTVSSLAINGRNTEGLIDILRGSAVFCGEFSPDLPVATVDGVHLTW